MSPGPHAPAPAIPGVELLEVIGSGGSGVVYRGRQTAFDRDVAVKVASAGSDTDDEAVARWEREVAAIGRLSNHPNIVPVFDAGITDRGAPYLVMPFVPRGTLGDRLRDEGSIEPDEVADIGAKLAGTLATVHAAGVLHRDVKPDNVLWSPHGEPQLSDFGIARLQDLTTTVPGSLHATIAYAAPEVLAGEAATEQSDIYGLGATLYACLSGSAPHPSGSGEHVAAIVAKALEHDPEPLASFGVPAGLAAVVERALARRPEDRYADAAGFRDALAQMRSGVGPLPPVDDTQVLPVTAPDATRVEPAVVAAAPEPRTAPPVAARAARPPASGRGGWTIWLAVLAVVVVAGGLVLLASMDDGTTTEDTADAAATTEAPTTEAPTTEAPTTTAATTEPEAEEAPEQTEPPETTAEEPAEPDASAAAASDTAVDYIQTLDAGDFDDAWAMTTPRFQSQQDRGSWEAFWGGYDIEIVGDPVVDTDAGTVVVPLRFDDQREDYVLDVVEQGGGWLIDGPVGD